MLIHRVRTDLQTATKARDTQKMGGLRLLVSALEYLEKSAKEVTPADELAVVKTEVKKRKEAIEAYEKAGRTELAEQEKAELEVIGEYLPKQASEAEIKAVVERLVKEMGEGVSRGQLIGKVIAEVGKDKVDGNIVAKIVGQAL